MADDLWGDLGFKPPQAQKASPAPTPQYDPNDLAVRLTMLEEKDPTARKWVAGVIANRAKAKSGDLMGALTEPNAFEPWKSKQKEIAAIDPQSAEYKATAADVLPIIQGKAPDPSGGAKHFYAPDAQAELAKTDGRPVKPEFDDGSGKKVGDTLFFGGEGIPDNHPVAGGGDLWAQLGYDPKAGADAADEPKTAQFVSYKDVSPKQQAFFAEQTKGGVHDEAAPIGSAAHPYFETADHPMKSTSPGAFVVSADGTLHKMPGGPKDSSYTAGLAQGVGDIGTTISHMMPGSDDSAIKNLLLAKQAEYDATYGGDLKSGAGRFTGQVAGSLPLIAGGEAAVGAGLARAGATAVADFIAGRGGLTAAKGAGRFLTRGASLATQGATTGAGAAGLTSSANEGPVGQQMAEGALGGALLGPAAPAVEAAGGAVVKGAKALVEPLTKRGPEKIANRIVGAFSRPAIGDVNPGEIVPGSTPTLATATADPGVAQLERTMRLGPHADQFAARDAANHQARADLFDKLKGDEDSVQALQDAREAATGGAREQALKSQTKPADIKPVLDTIDTILKGPEGKRSEVVKALNDVRANLHDAQGNPETSAELLYGVRKGLNDLLSPKASTEKSGAQLAASELQTVRGELDKAIEEAAPGFRGYLKTYSDMSKPIDEQQFLQGLKIADMRGNITLARAQSALDKITAMRAKPGANPAKSISDETLAQLTALRDDLKRQDNVNLARPIGPDTAAHFTTGGRLAQAGVPLAGLAAFSHHPVVAAALGGAKLLYGMKDKQIMAEVANRLLNPEASAAAPAVAQAKQGLLKRGVRTAIPAAAGVVANRLVPAQ